MFSSKGPRRRNAIFTFAIVVNTIMQSQDEEMKMKVKCGETEKELARKTKQFNIAATAQPHKDFKHEHEHMVKQDKGVSLDSSCFFIFKPAAGLV